MTFITYQTITLLGNDNHKKGHQPELTPFHLSYKRNIS